MQVRQIVTAALLAASAMGAMAQQLDPSETLQARNLAAQKAGQDAGGRSAAAVRAETRNLQAAGQLKTVGDRAEAVAAPAVPASAGLTRAQVRADLAQWQATHPAVVGDRG